jgi:hypothetical protein
MPGEISENVPVPQGRCHGSRRSTVNFARIARGCLYATGAPGDLFEERQAVTLLT